MVLPPGDSFIMKAKKNRHLRELFYSLPELSCFLEEGYNLIENINLLPLFYLQIHTFWSSDS